MTGLLDLGDDVLGMIARFCLNACDHGGHFSMTRLFREAGCPIARRFALVCTTLHAAMRRCMCGSLQLTVGTGEAASNEFSRVDWARYADGLPGVRRIDLKLADMTFMPGFPASMVRGPHASLDVDHKPSLDQLWIEVFKAGVRPVRLREVSLAVFGRRWQTSTLEGLAAALAGMATTWPIDNLDLTALAVFQQEHVDAFAPLFARCRRRIHLTIIDGNVIQGLAEPAEALVFSETLLRAAARVSTLGLNNVELPELPAEGTPLDVRWRTLASDAPGSNQAPATTFRNVCALMHLVRPERLVKHVRICARHDVAGDDLSVPFPRWSSTCRVQIVHIEVLDADDGTTSCLAHVLAAALDALAGITLGMLQLVCGRDEVDAVLEALCAFFEPDEAAKLPQLADIIIKPMSPGLAADEQHEVLSPIRDGPAWDALARLRRRTGLSVCVFGEYVDVDDPAYIPTPEHLARREARRSRTWEEAEERSDDGW